MSDQIEEQQMEQEALDAIFGKDFKILHNEPPYKYSIRLVPIQDADDEDDGNANVNHVAIDLIVDIPLEYPDVKPEVASIEIVKGLGEEQKEDIIEVYEEEVAANEGMPCLFAVSEAIRGWLVDNNVVYDGSMYAQMMRKEAASKQKETINIESGFDTNGPTQTEIEEAAVWKRRSEGTPCTKENFEIWKKRFEAEMNENKRKEEEATENKIKKGKDKSTDNKASRQTGYEIFAAKNGTLFLEEMEAAADLEAKATFNVDNVNEELFDEDLDDLDFDSDDEDFTDEEDDEPQI